MGHASLGDYESLRPRTEEGERRAVESAREGDRAKTRLKDLADVQGHKTEKPGQLTYIFLILKCARHDLNVRPFAS